MFSTQQVTSHHMDRSKNVGVFKKENIELFVLGALFTFPVLKLSLISGLVALLGLYVVTYNRDLFLQNLKDKKILKSFLFVTLWVFFYWMTILFSEDKERAFKLILRTIPLIMIPFFMFFGLESIAYNKIRKIIGWFSIVSILFLIKIYVLV